MNKKPILILLIIFGTLGGLFLLADYFTPKKTDWQTKFGKDNKAPFGFYILYKELKTIANAQSVQEITDLNTISSLNPNTDVIFFIEEDNPYYESDVIFDSIYSFIHKGGTGFISYATVYNETALMANDSIIQKINQFQFNSNLNQYTNTAKFFNLNTDEKPTGYVFINQLNKVNYTKTPYNQGLFYQHADPQLLSNFYLLNKKGYQYNKEVFKPFQHKNIYWINPDIRYTTSNNSSVLSFIQSQPELNTAWKIILICLILYLIFKSRREQKVIPIIKPEQNLSLEFANVIASMYYETGKPNDIIKKKIDYFFYTIRKQFNVITENIFDEQFIYILAQKAQIEETEAKELINKLNELYHKKNAKLTDVTKTYHIIENYKKKAQIL